MAPLFQRIAELILKNLRDELSTAEREELQTWVNESAENRQMFEELSDEDSFRRNLQAFYESDQNVWSKIERAIEEEPVVPVRRMKPWRYVAAASIILIAAGFTWWFNDSSNDLIANSTPIPSTVTLDSIVAPTGHHSTLTLADGSVIIIDSSKNGTLAVQGNTSIIKKEGLLKYTVSSNSSTNNNAAAVNTLSTSRGGQQSITLPDGSYALLNAESSITYPTAFSGARKVQVKGEVYFEIKTLLNESGSSKLPFVVEILSANGQKKSEVEVLGTHFSINAYDNESIVRTTLIEGKVRLTNSNNDNAQSAILQPGQQAQLTGNGKISIINNEKALLAATAWMRNEFFFHNATIADILREAGRWYSISVTIPAGISSEKYGGTISRNVKLATLLQIFAESGIKFKLEEGNKLIVIP